MAKRRSISSGALLLMLAFAATAHAQTFTVLHNFSGPPDGANPYAGLIQDAAGNLYGTTNDGGTSNVGTVFEVDTSGTETVLYSFTGGSDGGGPFGGVVRDAAGNLYGTAYGGGPHGGAGCINGCGTVFKLDSSGVLTVPHAFAGGATDGAFPMGGVVLDASGSLYGTTTEGGDLNCYGDTNGCGVVFKVDPNGTETILHRFAGYPKDGDDPEYTNLVLDKKGNVYGITQDGGAYNGGLVYELSKSGKLTMLHSFGEKHDDGCFPLGIPAVDNVGNLYGTTRGCGSLDHGMVWKVSRKGKETVLHSFGRSGGIYPYAGVIMDAEGNVYGNTMSGGAWGAGTVYELNTKGKLTVLHSFDGSDGKRAYAGLIRDASGNLFGTTSGGGKYDCNGTGYGCGEVFEITQ